MAENATIFKRVDGLIRNYRARDAAASIMRSVRDGDFEHIAPGSFTEDYPGPIIANRIDTMARDAVASLTTLPSFTCVPPSILEDKARKFAAKRTRIARYYIEVSELQDQFPDVADTFKCYGLGVLKIEPDFKLKTPKIRAVDGSLTYPVWNSDLETVECVEVQFISSYTLCANYPNVTDQLEREWTGQMDRDRIKIIKYENADICMTYLPDCGNYVLEQCANEMNRCTYVAVPRPSGKGGWHGIPKGAYDDLVWPLLAANDFRMLALEATDKAVRAPIVVPNDVTDISFGPDATIKTNNPQGVQRLRIEVPPSAFQAGEILDNDIQVGGMSPASRSGTIHANVVTGRGVDALGEGYSAQIALDQTRLVTLLKKSVSLCFEMDEKLWPDVDKEIRGRRADNPFQLTYRPSRDIAGDYTIAVEYGFLLGLDANRSLIWVLQAQAAGLISVDTASRNLPVQLNMAEEQAKIKLEQLRGSLVASMAGLAQALPQMVTQGSDPSKIMAAIAALIEGVKAGEEIETVTARVFAPPPPPPAAPAGPGEPAEPGDPTETGAPPGPVQPGMPSPGARPDLQQLFAGMGSSGSPNLSAKVSRGNPVVGQ